MFLTDATSVSTTDTIGATAFTVLVTDAENDDLTFTMTCDPVGCPFSIFDCKYFNGCPFSIVNCKYFNGCPFSIVDC